MTYPSGPYGHGYGYGYGYAPPPPKPGVIPLAPLGLGDVLTGVFSTYGRYWKQLVGMTLIAYTGAAVVMAGAFTAAFLAVGDDVDRLAGMPSGQSPEFADVQPLIVAFGLAWLASVAGWVVFNGLAAASVPVVLQEAVLGRRIGFGALWRRAWSRVGSVIGSVVLSTLAMILPMVLVFVGAAFLFVALITDLADAASGSDHDSAGLAVTGLLFFLLTFATLPLSVWLWVKFSLATTAAVIERQGPVGSLRRSSALVRGSWWRIFGITLLIGLMVGVVSVVIQQIISFVGMVPVSAYSPGDNPTPSDVLGVFGGVVVLVTVAQLITQAVFAPFLPLVSGLLYIDQRIRRENLGQSLAQTAAAPH
ncbi:oxidoreductase [Streptomyces roseicoloratus]|uniref:oxidoreductase n=1 Tax=Streptomyces roseicoloratus TaxID=2508722 RepID=UPI0010098BA4|nr:oxidoreductase [Streptomyces roseicoloratus]